MKLEILSPLEALQLYQLSKGNCDLLDVRSPAEFATGHATGARNCPLGETTLREAQQSPASHPVLLICQSGQRARKAAEGFITPRRVIVIEGGTVRWQADGLPMSTNGQRRGWALERQVRGVVGVFVLVSSLLALTVHRGFAGIALFFGIGLTFAALTDWCGLGLLLARMPWNRKA